MRIKFFCLFSITLVVNFCLAQHTDVINSNRPGESMSGFSVGKNVIQVESGISFFNQNYNKLKSETNGFNFDLTGRYGLFLEELEVLADLNYQKDTNYNTLDPNNNFETSRSGFRRILLGIKYLAFDPYKNYEEKVDMYSWKANHTFKWRQLIPAVSLFAGMNIDSGSNDFISDSEKAKKFNPKVMLITQNMLNGGYVFVTNIFMDKIGTDNKSLGYVVTMTKGFNSQWSGFIENKYSKTDFYSEGILTIGGAYLFDKDLQFDFSVSKSLKDVPTSIYGGIGVSWRSDLKHTDKRIPIKKDKKGDKKDKKKDRIDAPSVDKKAKRIDEVPTEKIN